MEAILLNSGGIDSLASIQKMLEIDPHIIMHSVFVNTGKANWKREQVASAVLAKEYCASHFEAYMPVNDIIEEQYFRRFAYQTILIHLIGGMRARVLNLKYMITGGDNNYNEQFKKQFCNLLSNAPVVPTECVIISPISHLLYEERIQLVKDHFLIDQTVSCREEVVCNICDKCTYRIKYNIKAN